MFMMGELKKEFLHIIYIPVVFHLNMYFLTGCFAIRLYNNY